MPENKVKARLYTRYPISSVIIYNVSTASHYILGGTGIIIGYNTFISLILGLVYIAFSFTDMYILMPLKVCPNCPYYGLKDSLCISGLNRVSVKISGKGNVKYFTKRAGGPFCPNGLYIASLIIPVLAIIPALILNFSFLTLVLLSAIVALLLFRFFVIFTKIACIHCIAKYKCPQAESMGVRNL